MTRQSATDTINPNKLAESEAIAQQVEEFEKRGGQVQKIPMGVGDRVMSLREVSDRNARNAGLSRMNGRRANEQAIGY